MTTPSDRRAQFVLVIIVLGYLAAYVSLAAAGVFFFVFKTAIVPGLLAYALLLRAPGQFARDWMPFLGATILFDAFRGGIYLLVQNGLRPIYMDYVISLERILFGTPVLSIPLQAHFRAPLLDTVFVLAHGSHFGYFLFFGLVIWHGHRSSFWMYRRAMLVVMYLGLAGYVLVPTAPPWMAAQEGLVPEVTRVSESVYNAYVPDLYRVFDVNPVAAMPSLHVAFPVVMAFLAWMLLGRVGRALATAYAAVAIVGSIYLGEHYAVDAGGGALVALLAIATVWRRPAPQERLNVYEALALGLGLVALALIPAAVMGS